MTNYFFNHSLVDLKKKKSIIYFLFFELILSLFILINTKLALLVISAATLYFVILIIIENKPKYLIVIILNGIFFGTLSTIPFFKKLPNIYFVDILFIILIVSIIFKFLLKYEINQIKFTEIEKLLIIYVLACFISNIQSIDLLRGMAYLKGTFFYLIYFIFFMKVIKQSDEIKWILWSLMIWGLILSIIQMYFMIKQGSILISLIKKDIQVGWGRSNYIAAFYALLIPINISMLFSKKISLVKRILLIICSIMMISSMILTGSRGGVLALILGCSILFLRIRKLKTIIIIVFFAIIMYAIISINPSTKILIHRMQESKSSSSVFSRVATWEESGKIILKHPIFGVGLGNMHYYVNNYYVRQTGGFTLLKSHNLILELLVETGLVGFFVYIIIIIKIFKMQISNCKILKEPFQKNIAWGLLAGNTAAFIHSLVEPTILSYIFGIVYWTINGLTIKQYILINKKND
jgi:O-antigen ligase